MYLLYSTTRRSFVSLPPASVPNPVDRTFDLAVSVLQPLPTTINANAYNNKHACLLICSNAILLGKILLLRSGLRERVWQCSRVLNW